MDRRTWIFVVVGVLIGATAGWILEATLGADLVYLKRCPMSHPGECGPPFTMLLGVELSPREVLVWSMITGAAVGAFLGLLVDLVIPRRPVHVTSSSASGEPA